MTQLTVKGTAKIGDTIHPSLGPLEKGEEYEMPLAEFGDGLFEPVELKAGELRFKMVKVDVPVGVVIGATPYRLDKIKEPAASEGRPAKEG